MKVSYSLSERINRRLYQEKIKKKDEKQDA
jgi:hypothetical protein